MFDSLISKIREIYGKDGNVPLHAPVLNEIDKQEVVNAIDSGFVSSVGKEVGRFEEELASYTGAARAVAIVNGTSALHLGLLLSGVKSGDLVITQALTFAAVANAVSYIGAEPVFVDSDQDTLGLSPVALKRFLETHAKRKNGVTIHKATGKCVRACVPMHVFGHPVRIRELLEICQAWNIAVVEDAAEALGTKLDGKHAGTFAPIGVLSFNGNKIVTTGGGGALLFQDEKLAQRAKHLSTTAKRPHPWAFFHDEVGFNYRMPNLNAALGCAQMKRLPEFLRKKRAVTDAYRGFFKGSSDLVFVDARSGSDPNFWLNAVLVKDRAARDLMLEAMNAAGVGCRPAWDLMSDLPMFSKCVRDDLKCAYELQARIVNLPSGVPC